MKTLNYMDIRGIFNTEKHFDFNYHCGGLILYQFTRSTTIFYGNHEKSLYYEYRFQQNQEISLLKMLINQELYDNTRR